MANEIVKYNNDMNKIGLRNFNSTELDILMAIMSRMKEKGLEEIEFDFGYLKKLTKWKDNTSDSFFDTLERVYDNLISIKFKIGDNKEYTKFVLFTKYIISGPRQKVIIGINSEFRWVLNELAKNFTRFELEEFIDFKSSYTKEFFRRMKQFRGSGKWELSLEDFKYQLNIPMNYRITDIDKRVLKPILKELGEKYQLEIIKKYDKKRKGRPSVKGFIFTFTKEIVETQGYTLEGNVEYNTNKKLNKDYYIGRTLYVKDQVFNRYNYLKITNIYQNKDEKIIVKVKNEDDNFTNQFNFDNLEIWHNYFKKHLV
ncbi:replication initiation protein [Streptobacillus moniliformis]|uniref:replication initiation protein n=1 Tax=Streptobacillus moniliformis TaxID=34105 RepID=UPI0007E4BDE3|nr:replication initiation protein [Streptobacillus moniliformis]